MNGTLYLIRNVRNDRISATATVNDLVARHGDELQPINSDLNVDLGSEFHYQLRETGAKREYPNREPEDAPMADVFQLLSRLFKPKR